MLSISSMINELMNISLIGKSELEGKSTRVKLLWTNVIKNLKVKMTLVITITASILFL